MTTSSPWPAVVAWRNKQLVDTGRVFGYFQCEECERWFPSEREANAIEPAKCPLHDDAAKASRKAAGDRLKASRK